MISGQRREQNRLKQRILCLLGVLACNNLWGLVLASKVAGITYLIITVNIIVFLTNLSDPEAYIQLIQNYGLVPAKVMEGKNLITLVTSMFLHADIIHLGMNMFFLFVTGDGVERELGSSRFLALYMVSGIIAGLLHSYLNSTSTIPTIGASGAIFGVIAAFAILFPFRWLITLLGFIPIPVPAIIFVFITIISETAYVSSGVVENVAHTAHIGGFLAGVFLTLIFIPKRRLKGKNKRNSRINLVTDER
jgi:membrane associated rhomboid family serine protease